MSYDSESDREMTAEEEENIKQMYYDYKPPPSQVDPKLIVHITAENQPDPLSQQKQVKHESYAEALKATVKKKKTRKRFVLYHQY